MEVATPPRRVSIVNDDRDYGDSLARLLRSDGHDARYAHDGPQAIAPAAGRVTELALLDICMPEPSGFATARELRGGQRGAARYLVMTSAGDLDGFALASAGEANFDRCVDKTDVLPAVRDLIARYLPTFTLP